MQRGLLLPLLVFLFAFMATFGGAVSAGMMSMDGKMSDCPYMGMSGYCTMDVSEHLAQWQQLFSITLEQLFSADLLPLLTLLLLVPFFIFLALRKRTHKFVFQRWRALELFNPLKLAFARGIIHPKLYS